MKAQVEAVGHALEGHTTQLVSTDSIANGTTAFLGSTAGQAAANAAELGLVHEAVSYGVRKAGDAIFRATAPKGGTVSRQESMALEHEEGNGRDARVRATIPKGGTVSGQKGNRWWILAVLPILWCWCAIGIHATLAFFPILWYRYGIRWYGILAFSFILCYWFGQTEI